MAARKSLPGWIIPAVIGGTIVAAHVWWYYKKRRTAQLDGDNDDDDVPVATVQHLWLYPLKSCHRVQVNETECLQRGLKNDRYIIP